VVVDEYVVRQPVRELRSVVDGYHGYRQRGVAPARHRGLPSPYLTVIFTLDERLQVARPVDPGQAPADYDALIGGLHTTPAIIRHDGAQSGIQLLISPLRARRLFGLPAGELAGIDVHADDLLYAAAGEIQDRVREAASWPARFAVLDRALLRLLADGDPPAVPAEVTVAWHRLLRSRGAVPVAQLARDVGWSERHLANRFQRETGLTPKAAARVIRFDAARRRLQRGGTTIAAVAAGFGYYDQPHLVREFRALAGCSPSHWLATEIGDRTTEDR
jgi:AraC-like DNA-binding protein